MSTKAWYSRTQFSLSSPTAVLALLSATLLPPPAAAHAQAASNEAPSVLDRISSSPLPEPQRERGILVPGQPPLTESIVRGYTDVIGWVFAVPFTQAQRQKMRRFVIGYWESADQNQMKGVLSFLELEAQMVGKSAAERDFIRLKLLPDLLRQARDQAHKDPETAWVLSLYEQAHRPLAPGNPPLTREVADSCAEAVSFIASEVSGKPLSETRELKAAAVELLISNYPKLPAARQKEMAGMPVLWAALRVAWPTAPEADRASLRQQWRQMLTAMVPRTKEEIAAEKAQQRLQALVQKAQQGAPLSPAELKAAAGEMDTIAVALRRQGNPENQAMAARLAQTARRYRAAAAAQSQPSRSAGRTGYGGPLDTYLTSLQSASREVQRWSTSHITTLNVMNTISLGSSSFIRSMVR
jgi:hypothetical protein